MLHFYACYNNGLYLILTTTKFVIQNGIKQPCRVNTFWTIDEYVTKLEKRSCMVLPFKDFINKDTYAQKMADYGPILYVWLL